jgi:hypothetical protein
VLAVVSKIVITRCLNVDLPEQINKRKHTVSVNIAYILTVRFFCSINTGYINKRKHDMSVNKEYNYGLYINSKFSLFNQY